MRFLILGSEGQLGKALQKKLSALSIPFHSFSRKDLNIEDITQIKKLFSGLNFDLVINCAAYTSVDAAEQNIHAAFQANEIGPKNLAVYCNDCSKKLIHISTDFVFDGNKNSPYVPGDATSPINIYGSSKLAGEKHVIKLCSKSLIIRTSWVFGGNGNNFFNTICRLVKKSAQISIVGDQIGTPTYVCDLADAVIASSIKLTTYKGIKPESIYGTYHYAGNSACSWFDFAEYILNQGVFSKRFPSNILLKKIQTSEFNSLATRPQYSALDSSSFCNMFSCKPSNWKKGVDELFFNEVH